MVTRRVLIRDDQNPLPLLVNRSMPECIAWAGIVDRGEGVVKVSSDPEGEINAMKLDATKSSGSLRGI